VKYKKYKKGERIISKVKKFCAAARPFFDAAPPHSKGFCSAKTLFRYPHSFSPANIYRQEDLYREYLPQSRISQKSKRNDPVPKLPE
jgi:hypothetical protein